MQGKGWHVTVTVTVGAYGLKAGYYLSLQEMKPLACPLDIWQGVQGKIYLFPIDFGHLTLDIVDFYIKAFLLPMIPHESQRKHVLSCPSRGVSARQHKPLSALF